MRVRTVGNGKNEFRVWLVGARGGATSFDTRCNVIGPSTPFPGVDVADIAVLSWILEGAAVAVGNDRSAFRP